MKLGKYLLCSGSSSSDSRGSSSRFYDAEPYGAAESAQGMLKMQMAQKFIQASLLLSIVQRSALSYLVDAVV